MTVTKRPETRILAPGDNELMARIQAGSHGAFADLYDRYCDRAYRVARSTSLDDSLAQEAVQEAFIAIWSSRHTYRPVRPTAAAWLMTVVRHRAIDARRRNAAHETRRAGYAALEASCSRDDVAAEASGRVEACDLRAVLTRLPAAQREVIVLGFYGELTHTEIAEQLGLPVGTVKGRMRLGLRKLEAETWPEADSADSADARPMFAPPA